MRYWEDAEAMSWFFAITMTGVVMCAALGWIWYKVDAALSSVGMTKNEFYGDYIINDPASNLFAYIMLITWIISSVMYLFGKYKQKNGSVDSADVC